MFIYLCQEMAMKLAATQFSFLFLFFLFFFTLNTFILIIKHNRKVNFHLFNRIICVPLISLCKNLKLVFLGKKIWRNALALKNKNVQGIFETFILTFSSSAIFRLENRFSYCLNNLLIINTKQFFVSMI